MRRPNVFPVERREHPGFNDTPAWAIMQANGKGANLGSVFFQMPKDSANGITVEAVAKMCNASYEQGKEDAKREAREAINKALGTNL